MGKKFDERKFLTVDFERVSNFDRFRCVLREDAHHVEEIFEGQRAIG